MATAMSVFKEIAARHNVDVSDDDAVDSFYETTVSEMGPRQQSRILTELLLRDSHEQGRVLPDPADREERTVPERAARLLVGVLPVLATAAVVTTVSALEHTTVALLVAALPVLVSQVLAIAFRLGEAKLNARKSAVRSQRNLELELEHARLLLHKQELELFRLAIESRAATLSGMANQMLASARENIAGAERQLTRAEEERAKEPKQASKY